MDALSATSPKYHTPALLVCYSKKAGLHPEWNASRYPGDIIECGRLLAPRPGNFTSFELSCPIVYWLHVSVASFFLHCRCNARLLSPWEMAPPLTLGEMKAIASLIALPPTTCRQTFRLSPL